MQYRKSSKNCVKKESLPPVPEQTDSLELVGFLDRFDLASGT